MKKWLFLFFTCLMSPSWAQTLTPYNYLSKPQVVRFINMMHLRHGFKRSQLQKLFAQTKLDLHTLSRYQGKFKPGSTVGTWERFLRNVLNPTMYQKAQHFYNTHRRTLLRARRLYGVDERYIVALMGVESRFGEFTGDYRILDALATLAFHPNRKQRFFQKELEALLLFAKERNIDVRTLKGSFAGAMGCVQQLPSIARRFTIDFDGDGASVWDIQDCIGSIAHFMHRYGWKKQLPVAIDARYTRPHTPIKLPINRNRPISIKKIVRAGWKPLRPFIQPKGYVMRVGNHKRGYRYFIGTSNARILKRYNNSTNYAIAIELLARRIQPAH